MHPIVPVAVGTLAHVGVTFIIGFSLAFLAHTTGVFLPEWLMMVIAQLGVALSIWVAINYYRSKQSRLR